MNTAYIRTTYFFTTFLSASATPGCQHRGFRYQLVLIFCLLFSVVTFGQEPTVTASVDTTSMQIGEQISYTISVEAASDALVVFPEGQTFNPMEVVEALVADTTRLQNRYRLLKEYVLTQFDSGSYTIPPQRILINENAFFTDSLRIEVADVIVDTTRQKMYTIKPSMEVPGGFAVPAWFWWVLAMILIVVAGYFVMRRRKRKRAEEAKLPPYERALFELQQLDQSHLLENRQTKEYYSKLTEAVRRYLEDEVHLRALESTTSELIAFLELKMKTGELNLSRETLNDLKIILQRADLAKFANSRPDIITAKGDRSKIEHVINDTKAAIPEPTEEELLKDEAYRRNLEKRKARRKVITAVVAGVAVIVLGVTIIISTLGVSWLQDNVVGNPTREMLQGEWVTSEYGDPAVTISTPRVLTRGDIDMPDDARAMMVGNETFIDGHINDHLYVVLSTVRFQQGVKFNLDTAVEGVYANLENKGARNMIVKDEEFTTFEGAKGIRVFGTLELPHPKTGRLIKKEYMILNFAEKGGLQQITVIFDEQDAYAEEIAGRIINSVEFENTLN